MMIDNHVPSGHSVLFPSGTDVRSVENNVGMNQSVPSGHSVLFPSGTDFRSVDMDDGMPIMSHGDTGCCSIRYGCSIGREQCWNESKCPMGTQDVVPPGTGVRRE
jgi:hypothetical protein